MMNIIVLNVIMLNVIMLNVIMLNVIMLNVIILNVVAPLKLPHNEIFVWPTKIIITYISAFIINFFLHFLIVFS